jgi:hypothetical protein
MKVDPHYLIEQVAYEIYTKNGKVEGRDLDNWLEAQRIVYYPYAYLAEDFDKVLEAEVAPW